MNDERMGASLHLAGEFEPWLGILLAVLVSGIAWWLYRLETRKGTSAPLDKLLPFLRALAAGLLILVLTGPTLRKVSEEGERGRVLIFMDGSESMSIKDEHTSPGRKLLLAEKHGWLPEDQKLFDPSLHDAADLLAEARLDLARGLEDPAANLGELRNGFADKAREAIKLLEGKTYETPPDAERKGVLLHEVWNGIGGNLVAELENHQKFKAGKPDSLSHLAAVESPVDVGDSFGRRIRGVLIPPESGEYRFWAYSDDECVVRINPAGDDPANAREILRLPSYSTTWSENARSKPITLQEGRRHYFEVLHKEGSGGDHCAVGWTLPSGALERPIPGKRFLTPNFDNETMSFEELREKARAELVKVASDLKEGDGETAFRDALELLAQTALTHENRFRATFDLYAENLAGSADDNVRTALAAFDASGRWERASRLLTQRKDSILKEFSDTHVIEVRSLAGSETKRLWDNGAEGEPPSDFGPNEAYRRTDLASGLSATVKGDDDSPGANAAEKKSRSAAVLLTDGFHNQGASPFETAKLLAGRDLPVHAIGLGSLMAPPDVAVLAVEAPPKVLKDDRIRGSISLKDNLRSGAPFKLVVEDESGAIVWEKDLVGMNANLRRVDFEFSVEERIEDRIASLGLSQSVEVNSVPFRLQAKVVPVEGEAREDNNARSFAFDAITKKNSMLIVDGRPRWETRYLRNLFERDERWSVASAFAGPGAEDASLPRGEEGDVFPTDKQTLFGYDLLVFGEIPPDLLEAEELEWIRDFVAVRGGGIVFIDGPRQQLREYPTETGEGEENENPIASLLPVKWREDGPKRLRPYGFRVSERGLSETALLLHPSAERSAELWDYLPEPGWVAPAEALPGAETLLEATLDEAGEETVPLLVTRSVGAGRILYAGFDGTWRWRFEVGDTYHQRYWHQLASRFMELPFAVSDERVAIDTGASTYAPGETAAMRLRLRDPDGKPLNDPEGKVEVEALVWKDGKIAATVQMEPDPESGGLYRGESPPLAPGEHQVTIRASGLYAEEELQSRVEFLVREPESPELADLTCNEDLLREMAELSGGRYLREEQIGRLNELLKPISSGRLVTEEIALWQSYWWFVPIVLLLGAELFLRKRAGML